MAVLVGGRCPADPDRGEELGIARAVHLPLLAYLPAGSLLLTAVAAGAETQPSAYGRWLTDDGSAVVRVAPCGPRLCGTIERVLDPAAPKGDVNNPNPNLRRKSLVGATVLRDFSYSGIAWTAGRAYDPKTGRSYRSELRLTADGQLKVTGCVVVICRSRFWTRQR